MKNGEETYILKLKRFIKARGLEVEKVEPLTPDASTRRYFRLHMPDGSTRIAMVMGEIDRKIIFEEIVEKQITFEELPFINIGRFLREAGINVPEIYAYDGDVVLLQDFGSIPLDVFVAKNGFERADVYYENAIEQLVRMQELKPDEKCYAFRLRFSKNMFLWEFNHFTEHFMNQTIHEDRTINREFEKISDVLSRTRYVFTHRDYHSKNLMCLENGKVGVLDFQDALVAPYTYDLASLMADAYVDVPENFERVMLKRYTEICDPKVLTDDFEEVYWMTAVQRTLKAAGRFIYIYKEKKNPKFLPYVVPAVEKGLRFLRKLGLKSAERIACELETKRKEIDIILMSVRDQKSTPSWCL